MNDVPTSRRVGDVSAMLRVMRPLVASSADPDSSRRFIANWLRSIGNELGCNGNGINGSCTHSANGSSANGSGTNGSNGSGSGSGAARTSMNGASSDRLSPRQQQTLAHLLSGDSEKQIAAKLALSRHTVHAYVKTLYRHFGASSRGELLARWVKTD